MNNKLLIIDDEDILLEILKPYFERKGYEVFTAERGDAGLTLLKEHDPDLMLLDLHMQIGIQGIDILKEALKFKPGLRIVVFTGFGRDEDIVRECINLGAKTVVRKPSSLNVLKEALDKLKE